MEPYGDVWQQVQQFSMAITPRTATIYQTSVAGTGGAVSVPAGTTDGDVMFLLVGLGNDTSSVNGGVSDWTLIGEAPDVVGNKYYLYWKIANSEPASYTVTLDSGVKHSTVISCYTGFPSSELNISTISNASYTTNDSVVRAADMTVPNANSTLFFFGFRRYNTAIITWSAVTSPDTFTTDSAMGSSTADQYYSIQHLEWSGSGPTGNMDSTMNRAGTTDKAGMAVAVATATENTTNFFYMN